MSDVTNSTEFGRLTEADGRQEVEQMATKFNRAEIAEVLSQYPAISYEETATGGKVEVGGEVKAWNWTRADGVPPRTGLVSWLGERVPEFGSSYPAAAKKMTATKGITPMVTRPSSAVVVTPAWWLEYSLETLEAVSSMLADEIPRRIECNKEKDLAEAKALLARHNLTTVDAISTMLGLEAEAEAEAEPPKEIIKALFGDDDKPAETEKGKRKKS